jgi:peptide/nickel transport system substrate-binding protein
MSPPGVQATTHWKLAGWQSAQGPLYTIYDTLIHLDRWTEEYVPYLAESWDISSDAKEWTFRVKEGVPFYKQKQPTDYTMTVHDVIHSFKINFFPPYQAGIPGLAAQSGTEDRHFDVKSDYEFTWKLDKPDLTWGYWSSDDRRGVVSLDYWNEVGEDAYIDDPIGNGPFTFNWFELNQGLIVERVEDHYRQTPEFHELQFFYTPEEATRYAMLFTKESDIVSIARSLIPGAVERGFKVVNSTTPSSYTFMFIGGMFDATRPDGYTKCPPGDEFKPDEDKRCPEGRYEIDEESPMRIKEVREALNLAIDRDEINQVFFDGEGVPTTHWAFPPWWTHGDPSWDPYPFDPERAKELIMQAGYPNGFKMDVYVPPPITGLPEIGEMAEVIAQYFEQVGLEVELKPVNTAQQSSVPRNREHSRGVIQTRFGPPGRGQLVRHFKNNINYRQEWQMHQEIYDFVDRLESASSWPELDAIEIEAANWARDHHLMIPLFWLVGQVLVNPDVVDTYESRHLHMGPSRHHEYTVPVYK